MHETHILVVDDDLELLALLRRFLMRHDFRVTTADHSAKAIKLTRQLIFDLIVMDVMMPGDDGLTLTRMIRKISDVPILMLTAMGNTEDRIDGLEAGADDYMAKPFEPRELLLRIRSVLRRVESMAKDAPVKLGGNQFEPAIGRLVCGETTIHLTAAEISFLQCLATRPGHIFSRDHLIQACQIEGDDRAVDVLVARLRRKLEKDPRAPTYLQTVRGQGYRLQTD
ncbi:MAG: response regulator transcription factor [Pseudomonadota bacterium]